ncbi:MAG: hypothetical protein A2V70_07225 [Planctomycetes bacterium RBG_13_63_9]|nr:MAG: hypothetical protein A2V70_07225 [Planctomycetes bacterium RBG_13_63_9]
MKDRNLLADAASAIAVVILLGVCTTAAAETLLVDLFNDNSIDPAKWTTATPFDTSSVVETSQRIELTNRGHLITALQFNPADHPGGIKIVGQWSFAELPSDGAAGSMRVLTRCDGLPIEPSGEAGNGIDFGISFSHDGDSQPLDVGVRGTRLAIAGYSPTGRLTAKAATTYDFQIIDAGTNLFFTMTEVGMASNTASATARVVSDTFDRDFVVFHNREKNDTAGHTARLDNVRITVVPEPATLTLLVFGGLTATSLSRRRRRRRP